MVRQILSCMESDLPIKYLGLPLTIRKPKKIQFQPLIEAVQKRLAGWKLNFLSLGGRITLIKSVLSALPLHYMQALKIPKGIIKHIDRLRRNFLWKGMEECKGINCLVNWEKVCSLKLNGGMGIMNLNVQNDAFLLRWIWKLEREPEGQWAHTMRLLYGITSPQQLISGAYPSFFLESLSRLVPFYSCSVQRNIQGAAVTWRWTSMEIFTTASAYQNMHNNGVRCPISVNLRKTKAPIKVRAFMWVMIQNRILTQEILIARGCNIQQGCALCSGEEVETRDHIFWTCTYAQNLWRGILIRLNIGSNLLAQNQNIVQVLTLVNHQNWYTVWAAITWGLWRERNRRHFSGEFKLVEQLLNETALKIQLWSTVL